ncbi:MAG: FAD-dependent oxidoreductase [Alphaproteobacteria bacterium]|nr:FAD-dependent oxidoreductase [Alphaproteobacteria bacterium]
MARTYVVGAGLAGLSAALELSRDGHAVTVIEATRRAGGRCRSYHDETLGCVIDNGNHLVMSGNRATMAYLDEIGARNRLAGPPQTAYSFVDVARGGRRWTVRPNAGWLPWWIFVRGRGVPDASPKSYLSVLSLLRAGTGQAVAEVLDPDDPLFRGLWEPLTVAALNARPEAASAGLMKPVLLETFARGAKACRPLIAASSLADTFIDPAVATLEARGADIRFGLRVNAVQRQAGRVSGLAAGEESIAFDEDDFIVLAVPPWDASGLLPGLTTPPAGEPIVNVHYRLPRLLRQGGVDLVGIVGGTAQWVFVRSDVISITISAARDESQLEAEDIAARCWRDVQVALGLDDPLPRFRVIKEKRATPAQTPDTAAHRPDAETVIANLFLAGDWTDTGLPATIEGAIRSGTRAAALVSKAIRGPVK